jgi:hypothetical protein
MDEPQDPSKNPQGFAQAELAEEGVKVIISLNHNQFSLNLPFRITNFTRFRHHLR